MAMDLNDVRSGLVTNLATITGLRTYSYVPEDIQAPAAVVDFPSVVSFDQAMSRALDAYEISVYVLVATSSDRKGQEKLANYVAGSGSSSVKAAIESDKTLGGACQTLRVTELTDFKNTKYGNGEFLSFRANIEIYG